MTKPLNKISQLLQRASALHQQGQLKQAQVVYVQILKLQPNQFDALQRLGMMAAQARNFVAAAELLTKALVTDPLHAQTQNNLGLVLGELGRFDAAITCYDKAIAINAGFAQAHLNRGNALLALNQPDAAVASYDKAIAIDPGFSVAYYNRGVALKDLGQLDAAITSYDRAIEIQPAFAQAFFNRGNALHMLNRPDGALASYDRAIALKPDYAQAYSNRGNVLAAIGKSTEAIASYDRALSISPGNARALSNRGNVLARTRHFEAAVASYDEAIHLEPEYAEAYDNRGNALCELRRFDEALASYDRAIALRPDFPGPHANRGNALVLMKRYDAAIASFENAMRLDPDFGYLFGTLQTARMQICDWHEFDHRTGQLADKILAGAKVSPPFPVLALVDSSSVHQRCAATYAAEKYPVAAAASALAGREPADRIRIGYFSADYHHHAVAYLIAGLIELHDRQRFEIVAFSSGPDTNDDMRKRLHASFDQFVDVRSVSDEEVAHLSRRMGIDIAVDLSGFSVGGRTAIFTHRAAPIQVNYLGYPGTSGATCFDYIVADQVLIPAPSRQYYAEKIAYLPDTYQANDSKRVIADTQFTRQALGLPEEGFIFCCFNNNFKITPPVFDSWMRVLKAVEGSVLWLFEDNPTAGKNLNNEAQKRGVSAERLVFLTRMPVAEHLARHRVADLFLDTLPYNAHTTCSDALWAGLPVLTLMGETFAGRVAASLLNAVQVPELITTTRAQYEALAIELATNPNKMAGIRQKLAANRLSAPLFDTPRFARQLEAAYTSMMQRYWANMPPEHIQPGA